MKKTFILVALSMLSFILIGCNPTTNISTNNDNTTTSNNNFPTSVIDTDLTDQELVELDISNLELNIPYDSLPLFSENGTSYEWESSHPLIITETGYVINPPVGSDTAFVTLTLTASKGDYITQKLFSFSIEANQEVSVTSKASYNFTGTSEEYIVSNSIVDLYFVDEGSVPYIDVQAFINMVDGAIQSEIINVTPVNDNQLSISYRYEYLDFDGVTTLYEDYYALIDFDDNTFTVNNYDFFGGYVAETESDYGEGLDYVDAYYIDGEEVTIPLGEYNFDLVIYNDFGTDVYLMPFHIVNLLLLGNVYYDAYYNGDEIFGVDTFSISAGDEELISEIHNSSYNDVAEVPRDMKIATYNFSALVIDYFYGLKDDKQISGYDFIVDLSRYMIEETNDKLYQQVFNIAYGLDDLHTSHVFTGYYETEYDTYNYQIPLNWEDIGSNTREFYNGIYDIQELLAIKYPSGNIPEYELLNNNRIAIIHLTGFDIDTPDDFKSILDLLPLTVEDVVIDLSYNTGGNLGAVLRIFGYITENTLAYHSQNPVDNSAATLYFESDYLAYNYNWYVLTSSVTFSAANLFANIAKENDLPIIGQNSSGGASSIGFVALPDGSGMLISTLNVLSTRMGETEEEYEYISIEDGISVDNLMQNVTSNTELAIIIESIKSRN